MSSVWNNCDERDRYRRFCKKMSDSACMKIVLGQEIFPTEQSEIGFLTSTFSAFLRANRAVARCQLGKSGSIRNLTAPQWQLHCRVFSHALVISFKSVQILSHRYVNITYALLSASFTNKKISMSWRLIHLRLLRNFCADSLSTRT